MKQLFTKLFVLSALFTAVAFSQQYPYSLSPLSVTAAVNKYAYPSIVEIPTPIDVTLLPGVINNHGMRLSVPPITDVYGNINSSVFSFLINDGTNTYTNGTGAVLPGYTSTINLLVNASLLPLTTASQPLSVPVFIQDLSTGTTQNVYFFIFVVNGGQPTYVTPPSNVRTLPHLASGIDWNTVIEFTNQNSTNTQVRVDFSDQNGNSVALQLLDGRNAASVYVNINAHGNTSITLTDPTATSTIIATARIIPTNGFPVGITAILNSTNVAHSAALSSQIINSDVLTFFYDTTNKNVVGLALLNSYSQAEPLTLTYYDQYGVELAQTTETLCAGCQIARILTEPTIQGKNGTITASLPAGVTTLNGVAFRFDTNFFFIPIPPITNTVQ